jgi:hypothetical protein
MPTTGTQEIDHEASARHPGAFLIDRRRLRRRADDRRNQRLDLLGPARRNGEAEA